jgi:hypothetical protein
MPRARQEQVADEGSRARNRGHAPVAIVELLEVPFEPLLVAVLVWHLIACLVPGHEPLLLVMRIAFALDRGDLLRRIKAKYKTDQDDIELNFNSRELNFNSRAHKSTRLNPHWPKPDRSRLDQGR